MVASVVVAVVVSGEEMTVSFVVTSGREVAVSIAGTVVSVGAATDDVAIDSSRIIGVGHILKVALMY